MDADETDPRQAAIRELFEEVGVLLARGPVQETELARGDTLRKRVLGGESFRGVLAERGLRPDVGALRYFAHWITPSAEPKRFSARFFVATLPAGQTVNTSASGPDQEPDQEPDQGPDQMPGEMDDACWIRPTEALARAATLRLPPPQLRILRDLRELAGRGGIANVLMACAERATAPHPILPRIAPHGDGVALLLPWDPDYHALGTGEALAIRADHPLAEGPSRFILEDATWKHVDAPRSASVG